MKINSPPPNPLFGRLHFCSVRDRLFQSSQLPIISTDCQAMLSNEQLEDTQILD
jgi:hypothetical protein